MPLHDDEPQQLIDDSFLDDYGFDPDPELIMGEVGDEEEAANQDRIRVGVEAIAPYRLGENLFSHQTRERVRHIQQLEHQRTQTDITRGIIAMQDERGMGNQFVTAFTLKSPEEQRQAMGDLMMNDSRKESIPQWWSRTTGGMGVYETLGRNWTPWVSGALDGNIMKDVLLASYRFEAGNDDNLDRMRLYAYIQDSKYEPGNFGVQATQIAFQLPRFLLEILSTKRVFVPGNAFGKAIVGRILRGLGKKTSLFGTDITVNTAIRTVSGAVTGEFIRSPVGGAMQIRTSMIQRMIPGFDVDEAGEMVLLFDQSDDAFEAFMGAFIDNYIEYLSERSAGIMGVGGQIISRGAAKFGMKAAFVNKALRNVGQPGGIAKGRLKEMLKDGLYNGIIGEVFEEKVGDMMRVIAGEMTFDELIEKWEDWRNWAAEALAFSVPVAGIGAVNIATPAVASGFRTAFDLDLVRDRKRQEEVGITDADRREQLLSMTPHVPVDPTQLQQRAQALADQGRNPALAIEREYLLGRGGPYTLEEKSFLDRTDGEEEAQTGLGLPHSELEARSREERDDEMERLREIVTTQKDDRGIPMKDDDPRLAAARRALSSLMRIQRQQGEITFALPQEPVIPAPDNDIVEDAREEEVVGDDLGTGRSGNQASSRRVTRLVRLTRGDRRTEGFLRKYAGTSGTTGREERARVLTDGIVDLDKAAVNFYRAGRRGEYVVITRSNYLNVIEGAFNLLSQHHSSFKSVLREMYALTSDVFDYDVFMRIAKARGFEGYIESNPDSINDGFVTLWRDVAPEEIVETEELTKERRKELIGGKPLIEAPRLYQPARINAIRQHAIDNGGVTYDPVDDKIETEGFAVSPFPEREEILLAADHGGTVTAAQIEAYLKKNAAYFLNNPNTKLGVWFDTKTGDWYLDIVELFEDEAEALDVATQAAQKAIHNLAANESIRVFATDEEWRAARKAAGFSAPLEPSTDSGEHEQEDEGDAEQQLLDDFEVTGNIIDFFVALHSFDMIFTLSDIKSDPAYLATSQEGRILRARAFLIVRGHDAHIEVVEPDEGTPHYILQQGMEKLGVTLEFIKGGKGILGLHDPISASIMINIETTTEQAMRQTFTHEWVHFLKTTRRSAWERFRSTIRRVDMPGLRLAGLDYYKRIHPGKVNYDKFLLWFESPTGQNEAVSVYVDQRMETSGFYDLIMKRDKRTFDLFRDKIKLMIGAMDRSVGGPGLDGEELDQVMQSLDVFWAIKELADSFFVTLDTRGVSVGTDVQVVGDLRGPEPHAVLLDTGMRALKSISRAKFEASGLIAKPWTDADVVQTDDAVMVTEDHLGKGDKVTIKHPKGVAIGYTSNRDMPGQASVETQGELFFVERDKDGPAGLGLSLASDLMRAIAAAGATHVVMRVPGTPQGKVLLEKLVAAGLIGGATETSDTGTSLHALTGASLNDAAITHREAKNDPDIAMHWAAEMQKAIDGGMPATKDVIRVTSKLLAADKKMAAREQLKKQFDGEGDIQSPMVLLMTGREELDMTATGKRGKFKGSDIARALDKRARALGNVVRYNDKGVREYKGKQRERIIKSIMEEVRAGFASGTYNGVGWYDKKIKEMIHWASQDFPELEISESHAAIFKYLVAITSNGNVVRRNYVAAKLIYGQWRTSKGIKMMTMTGNGKQVQAPMWGTGQFPTVNHTPSNVDKDLVPLSEQTSVRPGFTAIQQEEVGGALWSRRGWTMRQELIRLNIWMADKEFNDGSGTPALFINWLLEEMTVAEIRLDGKIGKKFAVSEEYGSLKNRRVLMLGPKVGVFFQNMMGIHDLLTMDIWFARMWNRLTGTLMLAPGAKKLAITNAHTKIKELGEDLFNEEATEYTWEKVIADEKVAVQWALQANRQIQRRSGQDVDKLLKSTVERMNAASDGVVENPGTGGERERIRDVFKEVQQRLKEYGREHRIPQLRDLKMSDMQALLWYNEQQFWQAFGVSKAQTESEDYGTAAKRDFQESNAPGRHPDAATAVFVGGGRLPDGRSGRGVEPGQGSLDAKLDDAVEEDIVGSVRRRDGGIDIELTAARQRLIDAGYSLGDAGELVTRAVIDVTDTNTRRLSVVIEALIAMPEKSLSAGLELLSGRRPVTGTQRALFVDPPRATTPRKRKAPGPKMGPQESKDLRRSLRLREQGRKEGKVQGVQEAVKRSVGIVESIFGKSARGVSQSGAELKALARAQKARTPEQVTLAAVALIRSHAQIEKARLNVRRAERVREARLQEKGRGDARVQKERDKAFDLDTTKRILFQIIKNSGLPRSKRGAFLNDILKASTPAALARALDKVDLLAAQVRFEGSVKMYVNAVARAHRATGSVLSNADRKEIGIWIRDAHPSLYTKDIDAAAILLPASLLRRGSKTPRQPRTFLTPVEYDSASGIARVTAGLINERIDERRNEKRQRGTAVKTTKDQDVAQIQTNLGRDPVTGKYHKEKRPGRRETKFADRERHLLKRGFDLQLWHDMNALTRKAERKWDGTGVLTRLIHTRMKEQEEEYNSELRDELRVVEQFLKEAGFRSLSHAYQKLMGTFGKTNTQFVEVTLQGETFEIPLDQALEFLALDENTLAKIAEGRAIKLRNMTQRMKLVVTIEEVEQIKAQLEPEWGELVAAMKARLETTLRPRLFAVIQILNGAEPELIPNYWPTSVDVNATDNAGLAKAFREGGAGVFSAVRQRFLENLGFTKDREADASAPFVINGLLARYSQHMDQALKIIHMAEATRDATAVLFDQNVADAINRTGGAAMYNQLKSMLLEASLAGRDSLPGGTSWMQVANSNLASTYILTNPGTFIRQLGGLPKLWNEMPTKYFLIGLKALGQRGIMKEMQDKSGFFWARYSGDTISRYSPVAGSGIDGFDNVAIREGLGALLRAGSHGDIRGAGRSWNRALRGIKLLDWFDSLIARVAWVGFTEMGKANGLKGDALTAFVKQRASLAVRSSQNTSSPTDSIGIVMNTRESLWQFFFLFTTDPAKSLNQLIIGYHNGPIAAAKATTGVLGNLVWSAYVTNAMISIGSEIIGAMISVALGGDPDEEERMQRLLRDFERAHMRALQDFAGLWPGVGDAVFKLFRYSQRTFGGSGMLEPIVFEGISDLFEGFAREMGQAYRAARQGDSDKMTLDLIEALEELVIGGGKLAGNPFMMPYYRARRILEPAKEELPDVLRHKLLLNLP